MAFPLKLTSHLTGATPSQLRSWRSKGLLVPAVSDKRPARYSFKDLIALRSMVFLRAETSSQRLKRAFETMDLLDLMDHPSGYQFTALRGNIFLEEPDGTTHDLTTTNRGNLMTLTFEDLLSEFTNWKNEKVVDFRKPSEFIEVNARRIGGWPTVEGTRVPYDLIANLIEFDGIPLDEIEDDYPGVTPPKAQDALAFSARVNQVAA